MNIIDIHSHILPHIDDGAQSIEESIELLKMMKAQGITDVIATPHFIASEHNLEEFLYSVDLSFKKLLAATHGLDLPRIYLGSEVYYFSNIGKSQSIEILGLNKQRFLLLELNYTDIGPSVIKNITRIRTDLELIPIIAHIERYSKFKGFKKLLKLVEDGVCLAQLNASSLFLPSIRKAALKLIKKNYITFIATDTHSVKSRPPMLNEALALIEDTLGKSYSDKLLQNLDAFQRKITS